MKATATTTEPAFSPVTLTITLESQEEVNAFADITCLGPLEVASGVNLDPIWRQICNFATNGGESVVPLMQKLRDELEKRLR